MIVKMTDKAYFSHSALSQSTFKPILKTAKHYQYSKGINYDTAAMSLGSMVHCLFLEPEEFKYRFVEFTETKTLNTKAAREYKKLYPDFDLYTPDQKIQADEMVKCLSDVNLPHPDFRELAGFSNIKGVKCKAKMDWFDGDKIIWDLKTTSELAKWEYSEFKKYRYDIQAMWYLSVFSDLEPVGFKWLVVGNNGKNTPTDYRVFDAARDTLCNAQSEIIEGMELFKKCVETNVWNGYDKEPISV